MKQKKWYMSRETLSREEIGEMSKAEIIDWLYYGPGTVKEKLGAWNPEEDALEEAQEELREGLVDNFKLSADEADTYVAWLWEQYKAHF